ncbi:MAG TPA: hypothetical protein VFZ38_12575 [Vicinamibacterales bacterium]
MALKSPWWRRAFGLLVIAHGLAHAVMPLRGWMEPDMLERNFMPLILYGTAVLGFTTAGIGLLGLTPFTAVVRPALVLASVYSLVAIFIMDAGDLWWGAALDVVLLLTALTGIYRKLPIGPSHPGLPHRVAVSIGAVLVLYVGCAMVLWPWHRSWGSRPDELVMPLPGDRPARNPALELQHAVTIKASPDVVWAWLVQLGQDRAGFYSYDWLERAFGARVHNVKEIRPAWQSRSAGDFVRATQPDYLWGILGDQVGWTVTTIDPGRTLVLRNWGTFVLQPMSDGRTRFIIRSTVGDPHIAPWVAAADMMAFELPHFIMQRKMMLEIKALAERQGVSGD